MLNIWYITLLLNCVSYLLNTCVIFKENLFLNFCVPKNKIPQEQFEPDSLAMQPIWLQTINHKPCLNQAADDLSHELSLPDLPKRWKMQPTDLLHASAIWSKKKVGESWWEGKERDGIKEWAATVISTL